MDEQTKAAFTSAADTDEDPFTAQRFVERFERSLAIILSQPGIGTPATRRGERRYPIPKTGHVINYRVTRGAVRIQLWYRGRQQTVRR